MEELIELVESELDDAAALGSSASAEQLARVLKSLVKASKERAAAIEMRICGDIESAIGHESASDHFLAIAREKCDEAE